MGHRATTHAVPPMIGGGYMRSAVAFSDHLGSVGDRSSFWAIIGEPTRRGDRKLWRYVSVCMHMYGICRRYL